MARPASQRSNKSNGVGRIKTTSTKVSPQRTSRSSPYRGVSHHRLTQRWEASLWLEGKQIYLGGFDSEIDAAHAYDLAALACKGTHVPTNYPAQVYAEQLEAVRDKPKEEVVALVRRNSSAFSRGRSRYRGVSGEDNRWEARVGAFRGRKNVSLGIYSTEEEAAHAYDRALIIGKRRQAKTNFPLSVYDEEVNMAILSITSTYGSIHETAGSDFYNTCLLPTSRPTGSEPPSPKGKSSTGRAQKGGRPRNVCPIYILLKDFEIALTVR
eukprot:jgi/Botrbrau1/2413/Bobra.0395s0041.1